MSLKSTTYITYYILCVADDQVVLPQDYEDLEDMTGKLMGQYAKWSLEVNLRKTEYICIGGIQDLVLEDTHKKIKHTSKHKFLGYITVDGNTDEAIRDRVTQRRRAISLLNSVLWDKNISKTKRPDLQQHC